MNQENKSLIDIEETVETGAEEGVDNIENQEMEEWMNVWQEDMGISNDLQHLREVFANNQWHRRIKDILGIVLMVLGIVICFSILAGPTMMSEFVLAVFILVISSGFLWKGYHRMRQERAALPLSPGDYLEASEHNLTLMERDNRIHKWVSPIVFPGILGTAIWVFLEAGAAYSGLTVVVILTLMVVLLSRATWKIYVKKPRQFKTERQALEALNSEPND